MKMDYISKGHNTDYIHPRFVSEMLRMGDLLDADNNRFNQYMRIAFGGIPKNSENHRKKHDSTRHILISPERIEYRADCQDDGSYREARSFLTWLEMEN